MAISYKIFKSLPFNNLFMTYLVVFYKVAITKGLLLILDFILILL